MPTHPIDRSPLCERLRRHAQDAPRTPAIDDGYSVATFEGLWRAGSTCADFLAARGVQPGEPVGLLFGNRAHLVAGLLGAALRGAVAVLLPASLPPEHFGDYRRTAGLRLVLLQAGLGGLLPPASTWRPAGVLPGIEALVADRRPRDDLPPEGFIGQLTSGVDAPPKIALRSVAAVWDEIQVVTEALGLSARDRVLVLPSITHSYGLIGGTLAPLRQGAGVIVRDRLPARDVLAVAQRLRPTVLFATPRAYTEIVADALDRDDRELSSLRLCLSAGAALPAWVAEKFHTLHGRRIAQDYGCTEAGTIALRLEWTPESEESVGRPLRGRTVAVLDASGRGAAPGELGEIVVQSPGLALGYLERSGLRTLSDAFATGDLGRVDREGRLFLAGRKGSLIHGRGAAIDPADIEAVIAQAPHVHDVAVVGVPAQTGGDTIKAVVVGEDLTRGGILEYCRRRLPPPHVPDIVEFAEAIPRTPAGKVLRRRLRSPDWRGP